ncbi:cytochrome P450 family 96 subfamily A polypeptide 1 [Euphorbia peplus]|nr:cytochrome P450 family 96 subfamily A polypeptide 1 [Euphorbia peplus]
MDYIGILEIILIFVSISLGWWLRNRKAALFDWPVVGHIPQLATNLHQFHQWSTKVATRSKGTFYFKGPWLMNMDMMCTVDPLNIKHIMSTNFYNYPKGPEFKEMFQVLGDGIFNADSDIWRFQRKTGTSVINQDKFRKLLMKIVSVKVEKHLFPLLEHVSDDGLKVDLQDLIHKFTIDTTFNVLSGHDPMYLNNEFKNVEYFLGMDYVEEAIFYRHVKPQILWKLQRLLRYGQEKKMRLGSEIMDRIVDEYITRKRTNLVYEDEDESIDLMKKLLHEVQEPNFTYKFLKDSVLNFMFAGRENSLAWLFWLLGKNPTAKSKIREELESISPSKTELFFEWESLNKLVYLQAAIYETLRLYPPVMYEHKEAIEVDVLPSGHCVKEKMKIFIPLYVMGRSRSIWGEDCEEFKPERWISDEGKFIQHSPYKFMSFSAGPRTCLGKDIALIQMKAISSFVIHNYDYELIEGHNVIPNHASIILHMKHGFMVRIRRRSSA